MTAADCVVGIFGLIVFLGAPAFAWFLVSAGRKSDKKRKDEHG